MRLGNTEQVVRLLNDSNIPEATTLAGKMDASRRQYDLGLIDAETWSRLQLQYYESVLSLLFVSEAVVFKAPPDAAKLSLSHLIEGHEIQEALAFCESFGDVSILMQAQYEIGRKQYEAGAIELANWELIQHKTKFLLWELAEQKTDTKAPAKSIWKRILAWFG